MKIEIFIFYSANTINTMRRPDCQLMLEKIEKIDYKPETGQAKALLALAYRSRLKPSILLNLRSTDLIIKKKILQINKGRRSIKLKLEDPLVSIAWDYIQHIPPYMFIFYHFRKKRKIRIHQKEYYRYDDKYYYFLKLHFGNITPKDFT